MTQTLLDEAYLASEAAPDDANARLRFFARLVEGELFLLLEQEAEGDQISPKVFDLEDGPLVLVFDLEERLAEFTGNIAPYVALSGRALVEMLAANPTLGMGLNLGVAPSSRLLPPEIIAWLAQTLAEHPEELQTVATALSAPKGLPEALLGALDQRLARMQGLAEMAYLVGAQYEGGRRGHMLAFVDAAQGAEAALAKAVQGALSFSGIDAGMLDVTFIASSEQRAAEFARVGLRFDLPKVETPTPIAPDPSIPPRLR